ncbi:MAG: zinc-ribbon domain-containing protein [Actinomycetota bacterium]|nr:zinc-ribbon domain-containing protein [Actinomycetota bacterium]
MQSGTCPNCGSAVQPGAEFCTVCGTRLAGLGQGAGYGWSGPAVPPAPPVPVNVPPGMTTAPTQPLPPTSASSPPAASMWPASPPAYSPFPATTGKRTSARPVAVLGAIAAAAGAFLPWIRFDFHFTAFKVPLAFLFQGEAGSTAANAGIALVVVAALGLVLSFFPAASPARRFLGLVALAVPVAFVAQLLRFDHVTVGSLFSNLGAGAYVAALGGLLLALG